MYFRRRKLQTLVKNDAWESMPSRCTWRRCAIVLTIAYRSNERLAADTHFSVDNWTTMCRTIGDKIKVSRALTLRVGALADTQVVAQLRKAALLEEPGTVSQNVFWLIKASARRPYRIVSFCAL